MGNISASLNTLQQEKINSISCFSVSFMRRLIAKEDYIPIHILFKPNIISINIFLSNKTLI